MTVDETELTQPAREDRIGLRGGVPDLPKLGVSGEEGLIGQLPGGRELVALRDAANSYHDR